RGQRDRTAERARLTRTAGVRLTRRADTIVPRSKGAIDERGVRELRRDLSRRAAGPDRGTGPLPAQPAARHRRRPSRVRHRFGAPLESGPGPAGRLPWWIGRSVPEDRGRGRRVVEP